MPRGLVAQTHGGAGLVDLLAARAGGTVDLHLDVFGTDVDLHIVVDLRHDLNGREGRLTAPARIERRHAHETVYTGLGLQEAVGVLALDHDRGALDAGLFTVEVVEDLDLVALALGPAHVHPIEHGRPVHGLGAALAGVEGQDRVASVVLAGEQGLQVLGLEVGLELLDIGRDLVGHLVGAVLVLDAQLDHGDDVLEAGGHLLKAGDAVLELLGALEDLLRIVAVVPEIGRLCLLLEAGDLLAGVLDVEHFAELLDVLAVAGHLNS